MTTNTTGRKLFFAIDETSEKALDWIIEHLLLPGDKLILVHVNPPESKTFLSSTATAILSNLQPYTFFLEPKAQFSLNPAVNVPGSDLKSLQSISQAPSEELAVSRINVISVALHEHATKRLENYQKNTIDISIMVDVVLSPNALSSIHEAIVRHQPTLVIAGSRGFSQLKSMVVGSVSHHLLQECTSVPVMILRM